MYKAAVIGCGNRAPAHIDAYQFIEEAKVVACCAPSGKRRDPLAEKYGINSYADPGVMIEKEDPEIVHIITWPDVRFELMSLVSEKEVPLCTVEKPIATEVTDWRKLKDLNKNTETKFAVCHQFRWHPYLRKCQQAINRGKLGEVKFLDFSCGMNIAGQGTHILNYGMSLNNDNQVEEVFGNLNGWDDKDQGHPGPVSTEAYLKFENGVRGLWTTGPISPKTGDPDTTYQHVRIAAYAEKGHTLYEEFGNWEVVAPDEIEKGDYGGREEWEKNNLQAQSNFHKAMFEWYQDESKIPGTNLKQSLHEWAVVLALYQSALDHRPVKLNNFTPRADLVDNIKSLSR